MSETRMKRAILVAAWLACGTWDYYAFSHNLDVHRVARLIACEIGGPISVVSDFVVLVMEVRKMGGFV